MSHTHHTPIRANHQIRAREVRLFDAQGGALGVLPLGEALRMALDEGLDLIQVSNGSEPPVCRIMEYGKYKYDLEKRQKGQRQQRHKSKELKFHPNIAPHDYGVKLQALRRFLANHCSVRVSIFFRGREMAHTELGMALMNQIAKDCADVGQVESPPRLLGRIAQMSLGRIKAGQ
jgi:translation initiation factor IF-3